VYFVTLCTHQRRFFFGRPEIRQQAEACWLAIPEHNPGVTLDEWIIMPNHLHGLVVIHENQRRGVQLNAPTTMIEASSVSASPNDEPADRPSADRLSTISPRPGTLSVIVRTYKAAVTTACRSQGYASFRWQRGYYEHVVRSTHELDAIRRYIRLNPLRWQLDRDNPANVRRLLAPLTIGDYLADLDAGQGAGDIAGFPK
jgi:REP element-mobilizing transposase RayT